VQSAGTGFHAGEGKRLTTVAIVGAGSVGRAFGRGLTDAGWNIAAVVAHSQARAAEAVRVIGAGRAFHALTRLVLEAEVLIVTTRETALAFVAAELARLGGEEWRGKTVLHTGCTQNREVLAPLEKCGAATGSIKPVQFFGRRAYSTLDGILFAVEGVPSAIGMARRIARALGGLPIVVRSEKKAHCGAAGEMVTAQVLALVNAGMRLLMDAGFSRRQATRAGLHLSRAALHNFEQYGGGDAWNAATSSGDAEAVAKHCKALADFPGDFAAAYSAAQRLGESAFAQRVNGRKRSQRK
jgi:predicted short-subunit dehydrogenase-like oxidoreductase (DUF2520 family)